MLCNFIETTLRHGCSAVNLLHIFRTSFHRNTSGWLLQKHNILCYLLYTHMTVERAKSRRLKIANVNFGRLVINIKQDYPVFWQTDKLQVINPEFCDQKCQENCVFLQRCWTISGHCFLYIHCFQLVSTSKICKIYLRKSVLLGKIPEFRLKLQSNAYIYLWKWNR